MSDEARPGYNPLDPQQRSERAWLRNAYFRQTGLLPTVLVAMGVFCLLALTRPAWAIPYLAYVMAAGGLNAVLRVILEVRAAGPAGAEAPRGPGATLVVVIATLAAAPFVALSAPIWPSLAVALVFVLVGMRIWARRP